MKVFKQEIEGKTCITMVFDTKIERDCGLLDTLGAITARDEKIPRLVADHSGEQYYERARYILTLLRRDL